MARIVGNKEQRHWNVERALWPKGYMVPPTAAEHRLIKQQEAVARHARIVREWCREHGISEDDTRRRIGIGWKPPAEGSE